MRDYELVMVLSPEIEEEETATLLDGLVGIVTDHSGSIIDQENWGVRRLAYPIQRFQEGNYRLIRFTLDAKDIPEVDRSLKTSESILRHLVTKIDKKAVLPEKQPAEVEAEAETEVKAEAEAKATAEAETEVKAEAEAEVATEAETEVKAEAEAEATAEAEPELTAKAEPKVKAEAEPEVKAEISTGVKTVES